MFWIKMQHYSCDFAPICAIQIRIEQAQILDKVFLVVSGQYGIGAVSATSGSSGAVCLGFSQQVVVDQLCFGSLALLMTAKRRACQHTDAEPRGHPTILTIQTATAQMNSREEVASDFISTG
jgi:hypothetical protein